MTKVKFAGSWLVLLFCMLSGMSGCKDNDSKAQTEQKGKGWLIRQATPPSEFAPIGLESAIENVATALNETKQALGMKMSFIPKDMSSFFEDSVLGARRAFIELQVTGSTLVPTMTDEYQLAELIEEQIRIFSEEFDSGVLNFGVAPNSAGIVDNINAVVQAGGIVVTFDSDTTSSLRQLFVGTNSVEAGKTAGKTLDNLIGAGTTGTVVILGHKTLNWQDGYNRTHEARKILEAEGHTVVLVHANWGDYDANVTSIQDAFSNADPPAVGCLGVFSNSHACGDAVVASGLTDSVKVAAFDTDEKTLQYMKDGIIQATHTQRVYYMGYLVPYLLYAAHNLGLEKTKQLLEPIMRDDSRIDTGLNVIYAEQLTEYIAFMDQLNAL